MTDVEFAWRGTFSNTEANRLHAAAFGTRVYSDDEWPWVSLTERHSLGWCTARTDGELIGFANLIWDGLVHAWLQDVMVSPAHQRSGIGQALVELAAEEARRAGCEWLHVDFDSDTAGFYLERCGFEAANAGLRYLQ